MIVTELLEIPKKFTDYSVLEYMVMPNHIHMLLAKLGEGNHSLGDVLSWFKSYTTLLYINGVKNHGWEPFKNHLWQRNYFDHIVRDANSYSEISDYIKKNPARWTEKLLYGKMDKGDIYSTNAEIKPKR